MSFTEFHAANSVEGRPSLVDGPPPDLERRILEIWMNVLERPNIGVTDNFYALGGDSLRAVQLISQIETELNVNIPPSRFYEASTVAKQVQVVEAFYDGALHEEGSQSVFEICPSPTGRPLFCFPGDCGTVARFYPLAERLRSEQGVSVVLYSYLEKDVPRPSLRDLAASCVRSIKSAQPAGPYYLGGYCFGATVAYEAGRQLHAAGEEVAMVALWDPESGPASWPLRKKFNHWKKKLSNFLRSLIGRSFEPAPQPPEAVLTAQDKIDRMQLAALKIFQSYRPRPYPGRVLFIYAAESHMPPEISYWRGLARGEFEAQTIPGSHFTMLKEPNVASLAEILRTQFQKG